MAWQLLGKFYSRLVYSVITQPGPQHYNKRHVISISFVRAPAANDRHSLYGAWALDTINYRVPRELEPHAAICTYICTALALYSASAARRPLKRPFTIFLGICVIDAYGSLSMESSHSQFLCLAIATILQLSPTERKKIEF